MGSAENKQLMQHIFSELGQGNAKPFVESMAEEFSWTVTGTTPWSRKYTGKETVVRELFGGLRARLAPPIVTLAHRFIADEDYVAIEARGKNRTKEGTAYENRYCFIVRLAGGKLQEVTEYLDTELASSVLREPEL